MIDNGTCCHAKPLQASFEKEYGCEEHDLCMYISRRFMLSAALTLTPTFYYNVMIDQPLRLTWLSLIDPRRLFSPDDA